MEYTETKRPSWALKSKDLTKWQKIQGIYMFKGGLCQVVFMDLGDPIGILLQKPFNLTKDGRDILGTFMLEKNGRRIWFIGLYCRKLHIFIYKLEDDEVDFIVTGHRDVKYLEGEERSKLREQISKRRLSHGKKKKKSFSESTSQV